MYLSSYPVRLLSLRNSFEDGAPVDEVQLIEYMTRVPG